MIPTHGWDTDISCNVRLHPVQNKTTRPFAVLLKGIDFARKKNHGHATTTRSN
jgi:hypothetical protein